MERAWARFPRVLAELTLASVWHTFHFKPLYYAHAVAQPLCLIHGDADESVPLDHSRQVYERVAGPNRSRCWPVPLPTAPGKPLTKARAQQLVRQWFDRWL